MTLVSATWQIDKQLIVDALTARGERELSGLADLDLPDLIDTERDRYVFSRYDLHPEGVVARARRMEQRGVNPAS